MKIGSKNTIVLDGCRTRPLLSYLKSLGILRLVGQQADTGSCGFWREDRFHLKTALSRRQLCDFFLHQYSPTPIIGPWNGGSGFYPNDHKQGIKAILDTDDSDRRFDAYRRTLRTVMSWSEIPSQEMSINNILNKMEIIAQRLPEKKREASSKKVRNLRSRFNELKNTLLPVDASQWSVEHLDQRYREEKKAGGKKTAGSLYRMHQDLRKARNEYCSMLRTMNKSSLIRKCRSQLGDRFTEWMDAAVVISGDDDQAFPPILGTGGNEGRLDYTNSFMERVSALLLGDSNLPASLLNNSLFADSCTGLIAGAVGQHDPGNAGGANQGIGVESKNIPVNPWDFVLAMEGVVTWAASAARRHGSSAGSFLVSPFTVRARHIGYGSAAEGDSARAEIWMPVWARPVTYPELRRFLSEGRADTGRHPAHNAIEFAQAAVTLGVDRGIDAFERYSLIKRRGDSFVSLPAGRFPVRHQQDADLVRELDTILSECDNWMRKLQNPPAALIRARRMVDHAIYDALLRGGAVYMKRILVAVGRLERYFAVKEPGKGNLPPRPFSGLGMRWLQAADDNTVEIRLAAALASIRSIEGVGPLRANLAPIDPQKTYQWAPGKAQTAWLGNSLSERLCTVLERRLMDADRTGTSQLPLLSELEVHSLDIAAFMVGDVDDKLLEDLLFACNWIQFHKSGAIRIRQDVRNQWKKPLRHYVLPRAWALLSLVFTPFPLSFNNSVKTVRPDPVTLSLLRANRIGEACAVAQRRLFAAGYKPFRFRIPDHGDGMRLAAALLFPVRDRVRIASMLLDRDNDKEI